MNSGKTIVGILNYNENKVKEGVATCIHENLFGCNVDKLTFYDKLKTLQGFINRNQRATTKAVHISLNLDPTESPDNSVFRKIATGYMDKIGFGDQPYLVYQHFDAAHPHIHIVTTNIQFDGKRISLHNIGRNQSESARKEIEKEFGLVRAQEKGRDKIENINPVEFGTAIYGKSETKRAISNTVRYVTRNFKCTSVPELNATLRQYNVMADTGKEGSQMNLKKGLLYSLINEEGKRVGVPIKASSIYGKPTLAYLEKQFKLNERLRQPFKGRLIKCIDEAFGGKDTITKTTFVKNLSRENIYVLFRQNEEGRIYGITFVDNQTKSVFNGSDLGKPYGAKALTERLTNINAPITISFPRSTIPTEQDHVDKKESTMGKVIDDLTIAKQQGFASPDSDLKRRRRKRRRGRSI